MLRTLTSPDVLDAQVFVTQDVFRLMAGMEVEPTAEPFAKSTGAIDSLLSYTGGARGSMALECSPAVACAFAARVTGLPEECLTPKDVEDALGKLLKMIGGSLKTLLPVGTDVSAPQVLPFSPRSASREEPPLLSSLDFACEFGRFRLRLFRSF